MTCERCGLYKTAQSVCLLGKGPKPCRVMFVGEAPGRREDDISIPFSGDAGKILDMILESLGVDRDDIYITNTVRCRPPKNRKPKASEIKACSYWMEKELEKVKPQYIVLLGGTALKNFPELKGSNISSVRGRFFKIGEYSIFPTFHPAAVLYDETKKAVLQVDLDNFWQAVKGKKKTRESGFNPVLVSSMDRLKRCFADLEDNKIISLDLETEGLDPFGSGKIVMIGLGTKKNQWVISLNHRDSQFGRSLNKLKFFELLARVLKTKRVVTQNGKFDTLWIKVKYGVDIDVSHDTMIMSYLLDENTPNGLKFLASTNFGAPDYDITKEQKTGGASLDLLTEYNAKDVYYTRKLFFLFYKKLRLDYRLLKFYNHVMIPAIQAFRDVEYNGIHVDLERLESSSELLSNKLSGIKKKLKKYGDINWNSTKQVANLMFNEMDIKPLEFTETGDYSTAETVMKRLAKKNPVASLIMDYRETSKSLTFVSGWDEKLIEERLHPTFNLIKVWEREKSKGTVTGRLSSYIQQVPRDPELRSNFGAPEGWSFVEVDLSQIELRIVAMLSGDRAMKLVFQTGGDIHTKTAIMVSGIDLSGQGGFKAKEWRKKAKATNFGFVYGMGVDTFLIYARDKYDVIFNYDEGEFIRERFFSTYTGLRPWYKKQIRMANLNGYVRCLSGRVRHLPNIDSNNKGMRSYAERQSINSPVQGLASDITLMATIEITDTFPVEILRVNGTVHDSILMEVKNEHLSEILPQIKGIMESPKSFEKLDINPTVPIVAEISVGPWGSGIKWEDKKC